jgi:hypothetical protein
VAGFLDYSDAVPPADASCLKGQWKVVEVLGKSVGKRMEERGNVASSRRHLMQVQMSQLQRATKPGLLTTVDFHFSVDIS